MAAKKSPFLGLAYFEAADQERFGGRERDVQTVTSSILRRRAFALFGRSGLGKTSLLLAGVVPRLEARGCRCVVVRLLVEPLADLHAALVQRFGGENDDDSVGILEKAGEAGPVVLVFDQLEELFQRFGDSDFERSGAERLSAEERRRRQTQMKEFLRFLARLAGDPELNLRLVFSLREEWIADLEPLAQAIPVLERSRHRLLPLTAFGVRQSILQMLRAADVDFDPRIVSGLVEFMAAAGFDPAVLQVVATEAWEHAIRRAGDGPVRLQLEDLRAAGDVDRVFSVYVARAVQAVSTTARGRRLQTRALLDSLITPKQTKRALPRAALETAYFAITSDELDEILGSLVHHQLLRRDRRGEEDWYELIHERLIDPILYWLKADTEFNRLRAARALVVNTCAVPGWKENADSLLSLEQLDATIGPFAADLRFDEQQAELLVASAIYRGSERLETWVERAGDETTRRWIEWLLQDPDRPAARIGAVRALGRLDPDDRAEGEGADAARCLDLALFDPDEGVRRAAGTSFARLANEDDLRGLAGRARGWFGHRASLDVLADLVAASRELPSDIFSRWQRLRAGRTLARRRLDESATALRKREVRGARAGLWAGLVWGFTLGPAGLWVVNAEFSPYFDWKSSELLWLLVALPIAFFASCFGWLVARAAGLLALATRREPTLLRVLRHRSLVLPIVVLSAPTLFSGFFTLAISLILAAGLSALVSPVLQARHRPLGLWCRCWLTAFVFAAFPVALLWWLFGLASFDGVDLLFLLAKSLAYFSAVGLVAGIALTYSSPGFLLDFPAELELGETPATAPAKSRRRRWVTVVILAVSSGVLFVLSNGWGILPFSDTRVVLDGSEHRIDFRSALFDTRWVKLVNESWRPQVLTLTLPPHSRLLARGKASGATDAELTERWVIPPGTTRIALQHTSASGGRSVTIDSTMPADAGEIALAFGEERFVRQTLERKGSRWVGRLQGRLTGPDSARGATLYLNLLGISGGHCDVPFRSAIVSGRTLGGVSCLPPEDELSQVNPNLIAPPTPEHEFDLSISVPVVDSEGTEGPSTSRGIVLFWRLVSGTYNDLEPQEQESLASHQESISFDMQQSASAIEEIMDRRQKAEASLESLPWEVAATELLAAQRLARYRAEKTQTDVEPDALLDVDEVEEKTRRAFEAGDPELRSVLDKPALALELAQKKRVLEQKLADIDSDLEDARKRSEDLARWPGAEGP